MSRLNSTSLTSTARTTADVETKSADLTPAEPTSVQPPAVDPAQETVSHLTMVLALWHPEKLTVRAGLHLADACATSEPRTFKVSVVTSVGNPICADNIFKLEKGQSIDALCVMVRERASRGNPLSADFYDDLKGVSDKSERAATEHLKSARELYHQSSSHHDADRAAIRAMMEEAISIQAEKPSDRGWVSHLPKYHPKDDKMNPGFQGNYACMDFDTEFDFERARNSSWKSSTTKEDRCHEVVLVKARDDKQNWKCFIDNSRGIRMLTRALPQSEIIQNGECCSGLPWDKKLNRKQLEQIHAIRSNRLVVLQTEPKGPQGYRPRLLVKCGDCVVYMRINVPGKGAQGGVGTHVDLIDMRRKSARSIVDSGVWRRATLFYFLKETILRHIADPKISNRFRMDLASLIGAWGEQDRPNFPKLHDLRFLMDWDCRTKGSAGGRLPYVLSLFHECDGWQKAKAELIHFSW